MCCKNLLFNSDRHRTYRHDCGEDGYHMIDKLKFRRDGVVSGTTSHLLRVHFIKRYQTE